LSRQAWNSPNKKGPQWQPLGDKMMCVQRCNEFLFEIITRNFQCTYRRPPSPEFGGNGAANFDKAWWPAPLDSGTNNLLSDGHLSTEALCIEAR
jgi:hypothetical protein